MSQAPYRTFVLSLTSSAKQTDGARNLFEKATGKNVPEKFSN